MNLQFESLRTDWYAANTVLPRVFVKSLTTGSPLTLVGFPAIWIPVCSHYGVSIRNPMSPLSYTPIFSDLSVDQIAALTQGTRNNGASRSLVEAVAALDPVIADFVYIVDHKLAARGYVDPGATGQNNLNTWHSFGRPEIVRLQLAMSEVKTSGRDFVMLPCSRHRPYSESRTHTRLRRTLAAAGYHTSDFEQVVVTAIGIVPESHWREPLVMTYDAGAVDLWRVFQLLRKFFSVNRPRSVVDCLSFRPYSEMLDDLHQARIIPQPIRPVKVRWRGFQVRPR